MIFIFGYIELGASWVQVQEGYFAVIDDKAHVNQDYYIVFYIPIVIDLLFSC